MSWQAFRQRCRRDREELFQACRQQLGAPRDFLPADWLDDILTDLVDFDLVEEALPEGQMALCDFDRRLVVLSTRLADCVRPGTNLKAVANSTKAHELGHIRLHEEELRGQSELVTFRDEMRPLQSEEERREREADTYAALFLVPEGMLWERPEMRELLALHASEGELGSEALWERVNALAGFFGVSGSLMRKLLVADLGLLGSDDETRELWLRRGALFEL